MFKLARLKREKIEKQENLDELKKMRIIEMFKDKYYKQPSDPLTREEFEKSYQKFDKYLKHKNRNLKRE